MSAPPPVSRPHAPRERLPTEEANPASSDFDRLSIEEAFDVFDAEDERVNTAVRAARPAIVRAIELVSERLGRGGRLIYAGAGTSGRLGLLDAVECPPTFQTHPELVQGRIAGGPEAVWRSIEGAEDSAEAGARALDDAGPDDVVLGIAAGGTTPWVHGALARASQRGAATVFLACVSSADAPDRADLSIRVLTGPEVLAGSTRLKAGTATKLVLNRITTIAMARLGRVYGNLMVDLDTRANAKLRARGVTMLERLTGLSGKAAAELLDGARGRVKVALVMHRLGLEEAAARARLEGCRGLVREALRPGPAAADGS